MMLQSLWQAKLREKIYLLPWQRAKNSHLMKTKKRRSFKQQQLLLTKKARVKKPSRRRRDQEVPLLLIMLALELELLSVELVRLHYSRQERRDNRLRVPRNCVAP